MNSRKRKLRNKLARQVIDGKVTVAEGRRRLGGKYARTPAPPVAKTQGGAASWPPRRYPGETVTMDDYLLDAVRMPMPGTAMAVGQRPGRAPQRPVAKSRQAPPPESAPPRPVHWSPAHREMLLDAEYHHDPARREAAREYLVSKGMLWGEPAAGRSSTRTVQVVITPGPAGTTAGPPTMADVFRIAVPGMTGR